MNFYEFYRLINEYGQNLIETLTKKFMEEEPALTPNIIKIYIDRFENIKNNLPEKDITKYSWSDLESTVDGYQGKERIKAGKLDPTVSDANLIFNKEGIRIYVGKDKKSCIKYSNGYTFCIGSRGENNMYGYYRLSRKGTPYFIFNDNLPQTDKRHLIVLFVYKEENSGHSYSVTLADNQKEHKYPTIESIASDFHWVGNLMPFLKNDKKGVVEPPPLEYLEHYLKKCLDNVENYIKIFSLPKNLDTNDTWSDSLNISLTSLIKSADKQKLEDFLNDNAQIAFIRMYPVLFEGHIPVKDAEAAKEIFADLISNRSKGNSKKHLKAWGGSAFVGIDFPRYFTFFTKNSEETLKNIKQKAKYFLEEYKVEKDSDEVLKSLNQKEQTFQNLLENNREIKKSLVNKSKSAEELFSFWELFKNSGDTTIIPYLVIQINNAKEEASKLIKHNIDEINSLYNEKNRYNKCLNYIKTLSSEQQQKILDFCDAAKKDSSSIFERDLFNSLGHGGCFIFKIIEYVMKNKDILNKNLNPSQMSMFTQKIYYSTKKETDRLKI